MKRNSLIGCLVLTIVGAVTPGGPLLVSGSALRDLCSSLCNSAAAETEEEEEEEEAVEALTATHSSQLSHPSPHPGEQQPSVGPRPGALPSSPLLTRTR